MRIGCLIACLSLLACGSGPCSALIQATQAGNGAKVEQLLLEGANVNCRDDRGRTSLMHAALGGHHAIAAYIAQFPIEPEAQDWEGNTALIYAAAGDHLAIVQQLIAIGIDINHRNEYGNNALMWAAQSGGLGTIEVLLEAGADPSLRNDLGWTAADIATRQNHQEIATRLRQP